MVLPVCLSFLSHIVITLFMFRCTALSSNLDGPADMRSKEVDDVLLQELSDTVLWDNYGIDADVEVSSLH